MGLESGFVNVNLVSTWANVGQEKEERSCRNDKHGWSCEWWNNVWRLCNPQLCPWECSLALHQRAETHHDSVTVKYCSPALSGRLQAEQQGLLCELSRNLTIVAVDKVISLLIITNLCCVVVNWRWVESRLLSMSGNRVQHVVIRLHLKWYLSWVWDFCFHKCSWAVSCLYVLAI